MSTEPTVETAFPAPRRGPFHEGVGWALIAVGVCWLVAALWAVLFVLGEDRGETEFVTAILNPLLPALLLPPGWWFLRAGLIRVRPIDWSGWRRRVLDPVRPGAQV